MNIYACRIAAGQLRFQPWKNGGGQTRQIAIWPPGADANTSIWRISAADVTSNGPFSVWPKTDRTLLLTQGGPLVLSHPDSGVQTCLSVNTPPFCFAGEIAYNATLQGAPVRDFNLMLRRGRARSRVDRLDTPFTLQAAPGHTLLHVVCGRFHLHGPDAPGLPTTTLDEADTLWLADDMQLSATQQAQASWQRISLQANGLHVTPVGAAALIRVHICEMENIRPERNQHINQKYA